MAKKTETKELQKTQQPQMSLSDRFTNKVVGAYQDVAKGISITPKERTLIANYFVGIDQALKNSKQKYHWGMVEMNELALSVAHMARLGLDMGLDNMISFIPFKKGETGKITLTPVIGYKGYEYLAKTYGLMPPKNAIVELVYETDTFSVVKKDITHSNDSYVFEINNPFKRGEIVGGFGYLEFEDESLNKLIFMSEEQILTYRKSYYDKTFWTGENMKKMYEKTIAKQLFKKVTLDPAKVNMVKDSWNKIETAELDLATQTAQETIAIEANQGAIIDIGEEWVEVPDKPEETPRPVENPVENVENIPEEPQEMPQEDTLF